MESALPLELASPESLAAAHHHCAGIARRAAGNFYYAFLVLPRRQRQGIQALYAFCRAGDDAADDATAASDRSGALARLRHRLDLCYQGLYSDLMTLALADAVHRFRFEREHFDDLLLGIENDLTHSRYRTLDDLLLYCYRVASTVGLLCLKIFGADTAATRAYAVELGIGMQLTNILRDLREDWERGRVYLPEEELASRGFTADILFEPRHRDQLRELILSTAARARVHFLRATAALPAELRGRLLAARIMGGIYEVILSRIEADPLRQERVELKRAEKIAIARSLLTLTGKE